MKKHSLEQVIEKFTNKHGDRYDYSKIEDYVNGRKDLTIVCRQHGDFQMSAQDHLKGYNCPKCSKEKSSKEQAKSNEDFIVQLNEKFQGNIISLEEYINAKTPVLVQCKKCGTTARKLVSNLMRSKTGCTECSTKENTYSKECFIDLGNAAHNGKFNYIGDYTNSKTKTEIECPEHGVFEQMPYSHLQGHGCPKCYKNHSKWEFELIEILNSFGVETVQGDKTLLDGLEVDILIPSKKIGIELDGLFWHGQMCGGKDKNYHLNKTKKANEKGFGLIHIFESEWVHKKKIVIEKLKNILGVSDAKKIGARNCSIEKISSKQCNDFLLKYHIQGKDNSKERFGAFYYGKLVGVMTFIKQGEIWLLNRFATHFGYKVAGLASKMLKWCKNHLKIESITTFADRRWTLYGDNSMYSKIGFRLVNITEPNYHYFKIRPMDYILNSRQKFQRHKIAESSDNRTEWEIMQSNGYDRIYDCGNWKYIFKN